ncbi:MAG: Rrf2 family transcriptional regulator, partial [Acidobacteria bacterium]|nr:Rrf2 family transcriptional regulator [Acidobacteriota bacterium]
LVREGFLISEQGTNGGYRLARDPSTITTLEVIRAIDGPIILTTCLSRQGVCELTSQCTVREPLRKVHEGILHLLESITIADLTSDEDLPAANTLTTLTLRPLNGLSSPARNQTEC